MSLIHSLVFSLFTASLPLRSLSRTRHVLLTRTMMSSSCQVTFTLLSMTWTFRLNSLATFFASPLCLFSHGHGHGIQHGHYDGLARRHWHYSFQFFHRGSSRGSRTRSKSLKMDSLPTPSVSVPNIRSKTSFASNRPMDIRVFQLPTVEKWEDDWWESFPIATLPLLKIPLSRFRNS